MFKYQMQVISKLITISGHVNLCSSSWTYNLRLLSIGFTRKGKTRIEDEEYQKKHLTVNVLFMLRMKTTSQQYKMLEHSRGTPGFLAYIINLYNFSKLYLLLTYFVLCDFWQYSILQFCHKRYSHPNPGICNATLGDRKLYVWLRILRRGNRLELPKWAINCNHKCAHKRGVEGKFYYLP